MEKNSFYINLILDDTRCTMISPGYKHEKDEHGISIRDGKIQWNPDNLIKLENIISTTMIERHQKELAEILEKKILSLYVDCSKKKEDDIMFFIFKEYIRQSQAKNKKDIVTQEIGRHSIVTENKERRNEYIKNNTLTLEEVLHVYSESLKQLLTENNDNEYTRRLLNFECDITFNGLGKLMEDEGQNYLFLYLDKIQSLSTEEQQRINTLLYTRGNIPHDRWIRVKINNGQGVWKTRYSSVGHRIESPHDYSETTIYEDEL